MWFTQSKVNCYSTSIMKFNSMGTKKEIQCTCIESKMKIARLLTTLHFIYKGVDNTLQLYHTVNIHRIKIIWLTLSLLCTVYIVCKISRNAILSYYKVQLGHISNNNIKLNQSAFDIQCTYIVSINQNLCYLAFIYRHLNYKWHMTQ